MNAYELGLCRRGKSLFCPKIRKPGLIPGFQFQTSTLLMTKKSDIKYIHEEPINALEME